MRPFSYYFICNCIKFSFEIEIRFTNSHTYLETLRVDVHHSSANDRAAILKYSRGWLNPDVVLSPLAAVTHSSLFVAELPLVRALGLGLGLGGSPPLQRQPAAAEEQTSFICQLAKAIFWLQAAGCISQHLDEARLPG